MMATIEQGYFLLPQVNYSEQELEEQAIGLIDYLQINKYESYQLNFCVNNNQKDVYAIAIFTQGNLKSIRQVKPKDLGGVGKRITTKLRKVSYKLACKQLDIYLGKITFGGTYNNNISAYRNGNDFHFVLVRYSDGLGSNFNFNNNLGASGNYISIDGEINNAMAIRSLSEQQLPFHECFITRETIKQAIQTLSPEYKALIYLWYFPEKQIYCKHTLREITILSRIRNKNNKGYKKVWYLKLKALEALRLRVIDIQE